MLATLALTAALSAAPAQPGTLQLTNVRATYGYLGPARSGSNYLPGDKIFLMFDIDGLKVNDQGQVFFRMGMTLRDTKGKEHFKQEPLEQQRLLSLGGTKVPAFAHANIGADQPPGEYVFEVLVQDPTTKREAKHESKFTIDKKQFGIVRFGLFYDDQANFPAPPVAVPGQAFFTSFAVVGFDRDKAKKQPDLLAEMHVLDDKGKPINKPLTGEVKELLESVQGVPLQFILSLNRPGKYKVLLKATDKLTNKTAEQAFEVTVIEPK